MSEQNPSSASETMSVDAMPMSPRPQHASDDHTEAVEQHGENTTGLESNPTETINSIRDPPTDWSFNVFLNKIAESLTEEDVYKMKFFFEGEGGIGKGVLEKIKFPQDLFRILRTRGFISRDNLLYLQAILFWAGRKDLIQDAVDYSTTIGDVLHFYAPSFLPENGYRHVKFHVAGKDFSNYSRKDIELLRGKVQQLLFVPEKFVIICGIEPSSSITITFMIPEMYVEILQVLLEEGSDFSDLQDSGVDTVEIDGKACFEIKGSKENVLLHTEQHDKFMNVYEQLQSTKINLEKSEMTRIDLAHQVEELQVKVKETEEKLLEVEHEFELLEKVLSTSVNGTQPASLKELCSLKDFSEALHSINKQSVDKFVIQRMIDATINVVSTRMRESHRMQEQTLLLHMQELQSQLVPVMFERDRYKFFASFSSIDQSFLDMLQSLLQPIIGTQRQVGLTPYGLQMLTKISSKLRYKDKEKMKQKYQWTSDGKIEKYMETDPNLFLAGMFYKEIETTGIDVHCQTFIAKCLSEVGRDDLKKFLEPKSNPGSAESPRHFSEERQQPEPKKGQSGKHTQRQQHQQQSPRQEQWQQYQQQSPRQEQGQHYQQQSPRQEQGQHYQQNLTDQSEVVNKMAQQVQEMYDILQAKQSMYPYEFDDWKTPAFPFSAQAFQNQQGT